MLVRYNDNAGEVFDKAGSEILKVVVGLAIFDIASVAVVLNGLSCLAVISNMVFAAEVLNGVIVVRGAVSDVSCLKLRISKLSEKYDER